MKVLEHSLKILWYGSVKVCDGYEVATLGTKIVYNLQEFYSYFFKSRCQRPNTEFSEFLTMVLTMTAMLIFGTTTGPFDA